MKPKNVYEYFQIKFNQRPTQHLKDFYIGSYCGCKCKEIIDKGVELILICDDDPHVTPHIIKGVTHAIEIVCFG